MTRSPLRAALALATLAITLPVSADAPISPPDQVQYDNFTTQDKAIKDRFTLLVWDRPSTYAARMTYADAVAYCANGGAAHRLPSLTELLSLVDEQPHLEYDGTASRQHMIDQRAFPGTPLEPFWTSSLGSAGYATVEFGAGKTAYADPGDTRRVRCVVAL